MSQHLVRWGQNLNLPVKAVSVLALLFPVGINIHIHEGFSCFQIASPLWILHTFAGWKTNTEMSLCFNVVPFPNPKYLKLMKGANSTDGSCSISTAQRRFPTYSTRSFMLNSSWDPVTTWESSKTARHIKENSFPGRSDRSKRSHRLKSGEHLQQPYQSLNESQDLDRKPS